VQDLGDWQDDLAGRRHHANGHEFTRDVILIKRPTLSKRKKNILSSENKKKEKYPFFFS